MELPLFCSLLLYAVVARNSVWKQKSWFWATLSRWSLATVCLLIFVSSSLTASRWTTPHWPESRNPRPEQLNSPMRTPWKLATSASSPPMLWKVSMWSPSIGCGKGSHPFCVGLPPRAVTHSLLVYFWGQSPILCWSTSKGSHPFCVGLLLGTVTHSVLVYFRGQSPILCWSTSKGSHPFCVGLLRRAVTHSVLVYFWGQSPILCWSTSKGSHPFCVGLPQYGVEGSSPFCVGLPPYSVKNRRQSPILCCVGPLPYSVERAIVHSGCFPVLKAKFASCSQMHIWAKCCMQQYLWIFRKWDILKPSVVPILSLCFCLWLAVLSILVGGEGGVFSWVHLPP